MLYAICYMYVLFVTRYMLKRFMLYAIYGILYTRCYILYYMPCMEFYVLYITYNTNIIYIYIERERVYIHIYIHIYTYICIYTIL